TVVLTTHNLQEADTLAHRVVVIDKGEMVAEGTPSAIKARTVGKEVTFTTDAPVAAELFDGLPLNGLVQEDTRVRFLTAEPELALQRLFARAAGIRELPVVSAGLGEAFLSLT